MAAKKLWLATGLGFIWAAWANAGPVEDLKPGEWYEVPNSHMSSVDPCPTRDCAWSAVEGQAAVTNDWSGGAY